MIAEKSFHNVPNTKQSIIKKSKRTYYGSSTASSQTDDDKFINVEELKEICDRFNLKRKQVYNVRS